MKRKWLWFVIGGVVVLALVGVNVVRGAKGRAESVQLAKVRSETVTSTVRAPGKIEPRTQVKVSADIPGKIVRLAVKEGDTVRRGQLMLQLDDTQYRAALEQSRAGLASAEGRLREATTALKVSSSNLTRQKALYEQKLLSDAEWDIAMRNHESAEVAVNTANEEVARTRAMVTAAADNVSKMPIPGAVRRCGQRAQRRGRRDRDHRDHEQSRHPDPHGVRPLAHAGARRCRRNRRGRHDRRPEGQDHGRRAARHVVRRHGARDRQHREALGDLEHRGADQLRSQSRLRRERARDPARDDGRRRDRDRDPTRKTLAVPIQAVVVRTDRDLERAEKRKSGAKKPRKGDAIAADEDTVGRKAKEITGVFVVKDGVATFVPVRTGIAGETMLEVFGEVQAGNEIVSGPYKALRDLKPGTKVKAETVKRAERR